MTKTIVLVSVLALALAAAVAVKMIFFPSISDKFFQTNAARLRLVPPGLVVVRPTHFADSAKRPSPQNQVGSATVKGARWMVGINMTFQNLIATAYSHNPGRITLPSDPPKGNFDFLVTVPKDPQTRLQLAIRKKLGYTAQVETIDTPVLALKVEDPNSSGLKVSTAKSDNLAEKNGRLYFTHQRLTTITDGLEGILKMPVVDKTGLTNYYDFSLIWDAQTMKQIQNGTLDQATGQKILADWGLALEPDTASIEMLVVKKVK